jgi:hypothetical protein
VTCSRRTLGGHDTVRPLTLCMTALRPPREHECARFIRWGDERRPDCKAPMGIHRAPATPRLRAVSGDTGRFRIAVGGPPLCTGQQGADHCDAPHPNVKEKRGLDPRFAKSAPGGLLTCPSGSGQLPEALQRRAETNHLAYSQQAGIPAECSTRWQRRRSTANGDVKDRSGV